MSFMGGGGLRLGEGNNGADRVLSVVDVIGDRATKFRVEAVDVFAESVKSLVGGTKGLQCADGLKAAGLNHHTGKGELLQDIGGVRAQIALMAEVDASGDAGEFGDDEGQVGGIHWVCWLELLDPSPRFLFRQDL